MGHGPGVCVEAALPTRVFPLAAGPCPGVCDESSRRPILPRPALYPSTGHLRPPAAEGRQLREGGRQGAVERDLAAVAPRAQSASIRRRRASLWASRARTKR